MHEQPIVESLLSVALEKADEAAASKIVGIYLVNGELSGANSENIEFYFAFLSKDTIADQASIFFIQPPTEVRCRVCNTEFIPVNLNLTCPNCHKRKIEILSGRELYVESVEVE